ncbi:MAG: HEAT repeat domain-containing protein, partial [Kaistella sp.]
MLASFIELFFDFLNSSLWSYVEYGILLLIILALVISYFLIYLFRTLNIRKRGAYYETEKAIVPLINTWILKPYLNGVPAEEITIPEKKIKEFIGASRFRRRALIRILVNYITLYSGNLGSVFFRIYNELELYADLKKKLTGRNVKHIILAIDELDFFKVKNEEIMKLVGSFQSHESEILRESSNYYMLQVTDGKLNRFLMNLNHPLSEWERLQYYKLITRKNHRIVPQFYRHITSGTHPTKTLLCIDLCIYYYQVEVIDSIFELLTTDDSAFNLKLLNALGRFYTPEQAAKLKDRYDDFSHAACKVEILKALGRIGTECDLE